VRRRDVRRRLHRVAVEHVGRVDAEALQQPQLTDRGDLETGAAGGQRREDLRRRVALHRVERAHTGQRRAECGVPLRHRVQVGDQVRRRHVDDLEAVRGQRSRPVGRHRGHGAALAWRCGGR
jgi:hypothetical protein